MGEVDDVGESAKGRVAQGLGEGEGAAGAGFGSCDNILYGHPIVAEKLEGFWREKTGQQGACQDG